MNTAAAAPKRSTAEAIPDWPASLHRLALMFTIIAMPTHFTIGMKTAELSPVLLMSVLLLINLQRKLLIKNYLVLG